MNTSILARMTIVAPLAFAAAGHSQIELTRSTIDGGGVMFSASGVLELCGTIGQPDAGTMTGGNFALTGGFWFETPLGDCNSDGIVGLLDVESFMNCLSGPANSIEIGCECFDVNRSGRVDLADFSASQRSFVGE